MKYIVRALKYFVYLCVFVALCILLIYLVRGGHGSLEGMLKDGYNSLWMMAAVVAAFSAIYPSFGYGKRTVSAAGSDEEVLPKAAEYLRNHGYELIKTDAKGVQLWRKTSFLARFRNMFEDKIYLTRTFGGFELEGRLKEVIRLDGGLFELFNPSQE